MQALAGWVRDGACALRWPSQRPRWSWEALIPALATMPWWSDLPMPGPLIAIAAFAAWFMRARRPGTTVAASWDTERLTVAQGDAVSTTAAWSEVTALVHRRGALWVVFSGQRLVLPAPPDRRHASWLVAQWERARAGMPPTDFPLEGQVDHERASLQGTLDGARGPWILRLAPTHLSLQRGEEPPRRWSWDELTAIDDDDDGLVLSTARDVHRLDLREGGLPARWGLGQAVRARWQRYRATDDERAAAERARASLQGVVR